MLIDEKVSYSKVKYTPRIPLILLTAEIITRENLNFVPFFFQDVYDVYE